jgi:hypothetical protein
MKFSGGIIDKATTMIASEIHLTPCRFADCYKCTDVNVARNLYERIGCETYTNFVHQR